MKLAKKKRVSVTPKADDLGFALPLVLATLLVLSLIAVFLTERILTAQALARSDTASVNHALDFHAIEQDLIWRALLEAHGIQLGLSAANDGQRVYLAETPILPWVRNGTPLNWTGNYPNQSIDINPGGKFKIEIRDVGGLIDVNLANRKYIQFIAEKLEVPSGQRGRAVESLYTEIKKRKESILEDVGIPEIPLFTGLHDVTEICTLNGWTASEICKNEDKLRRIAYAGFGGLANITLASPEVTELLLGDDATADPLQNRSLWRLLQQDRGFDNVFLSVGAGYQTYHITVSHPGRLAQQYLLDVRLQPDKRPYRMYRIQPTL